MSYSLFFTLTGLIFSISSSIIIYNIYEVYPINKVTLFLKPNEETIFNRISVSVLPILIWSILEIPLLGHNNLFLIGLILNLVLNCSINYIIHYGNELISETEEKVIPIITIFIANIVGYLINYLTLFIGHFGSIINTIIGVVLLYILFILIKVLKPNIFIFKNQKK